MPNPLEQSHAQHDEEIALFLHGTKKSIRWTIIICFYSALHFLRSKIFPLTEKSGGITTTYASLDDYYSKLPIDKKSSMHNEMVGLAWQKLPKIGWKYQWLLDTSVTARYHDNDFDNRASDNAIKHLSEIKKECNKA